MLTLLPNGSRLSCGATRAASFKRLLGSARTEWSAEVECLRVIVASGAKYGRAQFFRSSPDPFAASALDSLVALGAPSIWAFLTGVPGPEKPNPQTGMHAEYDVLADKRLRLSTVAITSDGLCGHRRCLTDRA